MMLVLLMIMAVNCLAYGFVGGSGTSESPYQISTRAHLEEVENYLSACFILINDINLSGTTYNTAVIASDDDATLTFDGSPFAGSFNGNGHSIKNLTIVGAGKYNHGLFGRIDGGTVTDLGVENVSISGGGRYAGGIAATTKAANISGCYVTGTISSGPYVGGLVGDADSTNITDSYVIISWFINSWIICSI